MTWMLEYVSIHVLMELDIIDFFKRYTVHVCLDNILKEVSANKSKFVFLF